MTDLQSIIYDVAGRYSLPADLFYRQAVVESSLNPAAVGPVVSKQIDSVTGELKRAYGLFQFIPSTFVGLGFAFSAILDAAQNAEAAGKYMRQIWSSVKAMNPALSTLDSYRLALFGYNGGPAYIATAIKLAGGSGSLMDDILTALNSTNIRVADVQDYANKIMGAYSSSSSGGGGASSSGGGGVWIGPDYSLIPAGDGSGEGEGGSSLALLVLGGVVLLIAFGAIFKGMR